MRFTIAFIDAGCAKPYTYDTLENGSLGGTEGSTIRLAEGFAKQGLSVCIVQRFDFMPSTSPAGVRYLPWRWFSMVRPKNVIHMRARTNWSFFPDSKQFCWLHDVVTQEHNNISDWHTYVKQYDVTLVAVSDWHVKNIATLAPSLKVHRIYSPVDELCYTHPKPNRIDLVQMVWMSSPHKGLADALRVFHRLSIRNNDSQLVVFNPGYFKAPTTQMRGVRYVAEARRSMMRQIISESLCLFYPTSFEETFGLVAAEANALGTPVATYPIAALQESCGNQFARNEDDLLKMIEKWRYVERPVVKGQERFLFPPIFAEWAKLLNFN